MKNEILDYLKTKIGNNFVISIKSFNIDRIIHSVKVSEEEYIDGRILLEIENKDYSIFQFRNVIESITQNKLLIELCISHFIDCDIFKFEFEINGDDIVCIVYFENIMTSERKKYIKSKKMIRGETVKSYRWNLNSFLFVSSKYEQIIKYNAKVLLNYVFSSKVNQWYMFSSNQHTAKNIGELCLITNENTETKTIAMKMKRSISISDITAKMRSVYKKENLNDMLAKYEDMKVNRINFGIDKENKKFFTLYFEPYEVLS